MKTRQLGPFSVKSIGLGCMNLSHAYGTPPTPDNAAKVVHKALDLGVDLFDTAALYGFGAMRRCWGRCSNQFEIKSHFAPKVGWQAYLSLMASSVSSMADLRVYAPIVRTA